MKVSARNINASFRTYSRLCTRAVGIDATRITIFALSIGILSQPAFGQLPWLDTNLPAQKRAELVVAAMTLDEKIEQIANLPVPDNTEIPGCEYTRIARHIEGIPRLAIPTVRFINGGNGVRGGGCLPEPTKTGFPSATLGAATFNSALSLDWGVILGQETRDFAHQALLGPGLNLMRVPYSGRGQEYYSEDPYLAGVMGTQVTKGIQSRGPHSMVKHFVGNDDEGGNRERFTRAVRIPTRAMHELYLLPFEMATSSGEAAAVMCAYPHLNLAWSCENQDLLIRTLRQRWGFDGYVESDRRAMHSTAPSILAQTSVELDEAPDWYSSANVKAALAGGMITESDIDRLLTRRYLKMFEFWHFNSPYNVITLSDLSEGAAVAEQAAQEGIVLLKNEKEFLPLGRDIKSIALIGAEWFAGMASLPPRNLDPTSLTTVVSPPQYTISPEQGLRNTLGKIGQAATVTYNNGSNIESAAALAKQSDVVVLIVGNTPRETIDAKTLDLPVVPAVDPPADKCEPESYICPEGQNGPFTTDQAALVPAILAANPKTVVILKTSGMVFMPWLNDAPALLEAWFPGQADGDAVADILFGVISPSGKLPVTFGNTAREAAYATEAQYPGLHEFTGVDGGQGRVQVPGAPQLVTRYSEDLQMGYRWYEANNVKPMFPFGFGLSYTTFGYSELSVTPTVDPGTAHAVLSVTYRITNTGSKQGAESSQVYLSLPAVAAEPSKRLVGFQKVDLMPGASQLVTVTVDSAAPNHPLSYFEPDPAGTWADGNWVTPQGTYTVHVGTSSADTPLQASVNLNVSALPLTLKLNPETINLTGTPSPVTAVLSIEAPYNLRDQRITDVSFEGVPALTTTYSPDGRSMTATFDGSKLTFLPAGSKIVALSADVEKEGVADRLWVTTTTNVQK